MGDDLIEKPQCITLYRQSSHETRLSPVHLSEDSGSESDDEKQKAKPSTRIVDCKIKSEYVETNISRTTTGKNSGNAGNNSQKAKFLVELQSKMYNKTSRNFYLKNNDNNQQEQSSEKQESHLKTSVVPSTVNLSFKSELKKNEKKKLDTEIIQKNNETKVEGMQSKSVTDSNATLTKLNIVKQVVPIKPAKNKSQDLNKTTSATDSVTADYQNFIINEEEGQEANNTAIGLLKAIKTTKGDVKVRQKEIFVGTGKSSQEQKEEMAAVRPKSPRPVVIKSEKDESIWDKLGTLGRKKRIKEVQEVQAEGKYAIDSPGCPTAPVIPPEEYNLDDNEERCMIDRRAYEDSKFIELLNVLKEWINDELALQRIIVQDLSEDLYDGQVLQKLLEKLTGDKLDVPEVTQSEEGQKQKLSVVLDHFNKVLGIQRITHNKWSVEAIHSKNIVAITHLLVALARHFRPPVRLPEHVSVDMVVVQKVKGILNHKTVRESLTKAYDDVGMRCERDAFDTLFDHAPDKLQVVKKSLVTFVNKHLNKINFEVTEIESQFHDGVYLIMLMGLLEGFFVPHYSFHLTPHEFDQKVHNVNFAFELMEEVGLQKPKARPEDVVNMDLKSTLRVLYNLFLKYKTIL